MIKNISFSQHQSEGLVKSEASIAVEKITPEQQKLLMDAFDKKSGYLIKIVGTKIQICMVTEGTIGSSAVEKAFTKLRRSVYDALKLSHEM